MSKTALLPLITLDRPTLDLIERFAKADDRTIAWLVRQWIRLGLMNEAKINPTMYQACNTDGLTNVELCAVSKPGRPKKDES